jgi:hypothetical protein
MDLVSEESKDSEDKSGDAQFYVKQVGVKHA